LCFCSLGFPFTIWVVPGKIFESSVFSIDLESLEWLQDQFILSFGDIPLYLLQWL